MKAWFDKHECLRRALRTFIQTAVGVLVAAFTEAAGITIDEETMLNNQARQDLLKYSLIIVSSVPILVLYPFIKKFFMKGVMLGAVKG